MHGVFQFLAISDPAFIEEVISDKANDERNERDIVVVHGAHRLRRKDRGSHANAA